MIYCVLFVATCSLWRAWRVNCILSLEEIRMCDSDQPLSGQYIAGSRSDDIEPDLQQVGH